VLVLLLHDGVYRSRACFLANANFHGQVDSFCHDKNLNETAHVCDGRYIFEKRREITSKRILCRLSMVNVEVTEHSNLL